MDGRRPPMPMFPRELTVADAVVHQQDVRRGLDLPGATGDGVATLQSHQKK